LAETRVGGLVVKYVFLTTGQKPGFSPRGETVPFTEIETVAAGRAPGEGAFGVRGCKPKAFLENMKGG
jgi:hypothetical protein